MAEEQDKETEQPNSEKNEEFWDTVSNPSVEKIYANSFMVVTGSDDCAIVFRMFNQPKSVVSMTLPRAKRLAEAILASQDAEENEGDL
jgi:hypothetical protein